MAFTLTVKTADGGDAVFDNVAMLEISQDRPSGLGSPYRLMTITSVTDYVLRVPLFDADTLEVVPE